MSAEGANVELYKLLHEEDPGYGRTSEKLFKLISPLVSAAAPSKVLDFGCGKSTLADRIGKEFGVEFAKYDPAIPEHSKPPQGRFDLIINTDVMEHIPRSEIDGFLKTVKSHSDKAIFNIFIGYASAMLPNGENAHCTVESEDWWADRLRSIFGYCEVVKTNREYDRLFVTWDIGEALRDRYVKAAWRNKKLGNIGNWFKGAAFAVAGRLLAANLLTKADLERRLAGKRVCLVGNSRSLSDHPLGEEIDGHDIVVRINLAPIPNTKTHGYKTDILATSKSVSRSFLKKRAIQEIIWTQPGHKYRMSSWMVRDKKRTFLVARSLLNALRRKVGSRPSNGLIAFEFLKDIGTYQSLTLYGFDFFQSKSLSGHQAVDAVVHDFAAEGRIIRSEIETADPPIRLV